MFRPLPLAVLHRFFNLAVRWLRWRLDLPAALATGSEPARLRFAFSTRFLPPMWSGQAVVIGRLLHGLPADSYRLVRRPVSSKREDGEFIGGLPGKCLNLPPEWYVSGARFFEWIRIVNLFLGIIQRGPAIARALRGEGIDTLIGCSGDVVDPPAAFLAARILGCRFFLYYFDDYTEQWWAEPRLRAVVRRVERWIAPEADGFICPNEFMQAELRERHGRHSAIVRNPSPWGDRGVKALRKPEPGGNFTLVFTGAVYHLNYDVLRTVLAALERIGRPRAKLHVYTAQRAEDLARQGLASPYLEIHPHVPPDEVVAIQSSADALLIPFSFAVEAVGLVKTSATAKLADYLMAGRPILAMCPENSFLGWYLSKHRAGIVISRDDVDLVARHIDRLIRDETLRAELSRSARERARSDFDPVRAQADLMRAIDHHGAYTTTVAGRGKRTKEVDALSVVQISGYDTFGIQVNGFLLHKYLEEQGHRSRMLVYRKMSADPAVQQLGGWTTRGLNRVAQGLQKVVSTQCILPLLSWGIADHPWVRDADMVNLQLVHNAQFFSLLNLPCLTTKRRVILSVHDMFLFTGHCLYSLECQRWQTGCGSCPDLGLPFPISIDTSAINWKLKKWVFDRSRLNLVVGAPWQRERVSRSPLLSRFPIHYIPYGVDTRVYRVLNRQACRSEFGIAADAHVITFRSVTRSRHFKGTEYIIDALQRYSPSRETYLLTFEDSGGLELLRGKYRIIELGWVMDRSKIARALNAADVFLMPSIAEGFGLMAVESMACGTPTIVFEGTALPETINAPTCGIAVPYKDGAALARAIASILGDDAFRAGLRQNGLRHVAAKHTFKMYADRYLELYRALKADANAHV